MNKKLFYFGWIRNRGHGWYSSQFYVEKEFPDVKRAVFNYIDDTYTPQSAQECVYREVNIGTAKILAWRDHSGDDRPGSNSVLVGKGYASAEEMIEDARKQFSEPMQRQRFPLTPEN